MPFIVSRVNCTVEKKQNDVIREKYLEMLERILGKSKNFVMIDLQDNVPLYARGEDDLAAYIEINIYGNTDREGYEKLSKEITELYADVLNISPSNIFINYSDVPGFSINGDFY